MLDWISYWRFSKKPFDRDRAPFLAIPGRIEVVERIRSEFDRGSAVLLIYGDPGIGVSTVWREVVRQARSPNRRVLRATARGDRLALYRELASGLGMPAPRSTIEQDHFQSFANGLITARRQGLSVLFAIDDIDTLGDDPRTMGQLKSLAEARVQLLVAGHCSSIVDAVRVEVHPLTRSQAIVYLDQKMREAGRDVSLFQLPALARLQAESRGVPAALDLLAEQSLRYAASHKAKDVSSAMVEQISQDQAFAGWRPTRLVG